LAHRRPCRDDDQVRSLKAARVLVEPREAARDPGDAALAAVDRLELLERRLDDGGDGRRRTAKLRIRYTEDLRLGLVEQLECVRRRVVGFAHERGHLLDELAKQIFLGDDAGVVLHVRRRGDLGRELREVVGTTDLLQLGPPPHLLRERDQIDRIAPLEKIRHRDRKSTRLNSSHVKISYAVFCLKKKKNKIKKQ